jgi:hypothetical protein
MRQGIIEQAKSVYGGEMFTQPEKAEFSGEMWFDGETKEYKMAYMQGQPHVVLTSCPGEVVTVYYAPSCQTYSWTWKNRNYAWKWAKERKAHIEGVKACYHHNYR